MKKALLINSIILTALLNVAPAFAQSADISKVQSFITNIIQIMVTLAGLISVAFFVWGGFRYMTSSGNPEALDGAKKTVMYSGVGLAITLGAYVLMNIITQIATSAFGGAH